MENLTEQLPIVSEKAGAVIKKIMGAESAAILNPENLERPSAEDAIDMDDYMEVCSELCGGGFLDDKYIEILLKRKVLQNNSLKIQFLEGYKCCLAVLPFSNMGTPLSKAEIERGDHLKLLVIDSDGVTVAGFASNPAYIMDVLPPEVQALAFDVPDYETDELRLTDPIDHTRFEKSVSGAYEDLKELF